MLGSFSFIVHYAEIGNVKTRDTVSHTKEMLIDLDIDWKGKVNDSAFCYDKKDRIVIVWNWNPSLIF